MRSVSPGERNIGKLAEALNALSRNRVGSVTLTANATSTTVSVPKMVAFNSHIDFAPLTANAAAARATTFVAAADRSATGFIITHANNAQVDRNFTWFVWEPSSPF